MWVQAIFSLDQSSTEGHLSNCCVIYCRNTTFKKLPANPHPLSPQKSLSHSPLNRNNGHPHRHDNHLPDRLQPLLPRCPAMPPLPRHAAHTRHYPNQQPDAH
ncbi:hypothetical protein DTO013E5_3531 [Penicillium roqueforti]|nr:hypothetical protein LCP963914a_9502 [Penicillium roqueforti]KAI2675913.1 hypothetical protein CBS147355_6094 [Penicillium roqueforti]KAI2707587.1 hypothetical protein CBS147332_6645 [Penicillium roqueforti]KAI2725714.1 hypothetical protein CBS147354_4474 [Penicillium roqueforti]KAI2742541.1 hypothetical protein DTO012A1_3842 [Penicillium roqueforti]